MKTSKDLIDRLRTYASTRKGELAELITEAADALERQTCDDAVSRAAAINAVKKNTFRLTFAEEQGCEGHVAWSASAVYSDVIEGALLELPSAQQEIIHCKDCKYGEQDEIGRWYCRGLGCQIGDDDGSGFCSDAERRE